MRYLFGDWSSVDADRAMELAARLLMHHPEMEQALKRLLGTRLGVREELLDALRPEDGDREWLQSVHDGLTRVQEQGGRPRVVECEYVPGPGGFLALAASDLSQARSVRVNDRVTAGFAALRSGSGQLEIWPRIYRVVCANGDVDLSHTAAGVLEATGSPARAVEACLSPAVLAEVTDAFRAAAKDRIKDPLSFLALVPDNDLPAIVEHFEREGDGTRWGLSNAVTAEAHHAPDLRRRLESEAIGARIAIADRSLVAHAPTRVLRRTTRGARPPAVSATR